MSVLMMTIARISNRFEYNKSVDISIFSSERLQTVINNRPHHTDCLLTVCPGASHAILIISNLVLWEQQQQVTGWETWWCYS